MKSVVLTSYGDPVRSLAPAYAGTDFMIVRDGQIAALYHFFAKLS